jgi:RNA polymerase sigma-54 factor
MLEEVPEDTQAAEPRRQEKPPEARARAPTRGTMPTIDFFGEYLDDGYRPRAPQEVKELPPIENTLSSSSSLSDHLSCQRSLQTDDPATRDIGEAIIGNLDDDGYLVASLDELAAMGPWPVEDVERVLVMVQGFDPIGVAARDLQKPALSSSRRPRNSPAEHRHRASPRAAEPQIPRSRASSRCRSRS